MIKKYLRGISCFWMISLILPVNQAIANIPLRVSIKYIVDENGSRPATGSFNTDEEINEQSILANTVLATVISELRIQVIEIADLPPTLSAYSSLSATAANRDLIRTMALAEPTTWFWKTDAINVYVTAGNGSAISKFPPDNDIILITQSIFDTTLLHELGHSLNLKHTHQNNGNDGCVDTLNDNADWVFKDQMAISNYGLAYGQLTAMQQNKVDNTWSNIMSYHIPRDQLTSCQKDRASQQASSDEDWLLTKIPRYVINNTNANNCSLLNICNGTWTLPFLDLQSALDSDTLNGKSIILEQGSHFIMQNESINLDVDIYTRQGESVIDREVLLYELPVNIGRSQNPAVSYAVREAQREATLARKTMKKGKKNAAAAIAEDRAVIMKQAKDKNKQHKANVIQHFLEAEKYASGNEKLAIQMELAQRYWHSQNYPLCLEYYIRVADNTDQIHLQKKALRHANQCQNKIAEAIN